MKFDFFKKFFLIPVFLCSMMFVLFSSGCSSPSLDANSDGIITRTFDVSSNGKLTMDVSQATIQVETSPGNEVKIEVFRKISACSESEAQEIMKKYEIDFHHSGNSVTIESDDHALRNGFASLLKGKNFKVKFVVLVPEQFNLDLKTSGGSIRIDEIEGEVKVNTSGGNLQLAYVKGSVWGKNSGGSIHLDGCSGDADVTTSGDTIQLGKVKGEVSATTYGGNINVQEVMGTINAHTYGGAITASISKQPKSDCSLSTSGGSINLYLDKALGFDLKAHTNGGTVNSDFSVFTKDSKYRPILEGEINDGGPQLFLKTHGGSVNIKKL